MGYPQIRTAEGARPTARPPYKKIRKRTLPANKTMQKYPQGGRAAGQPVLPHPAENPLPLVAGTRAAKKQVKQLSGTGRQGRRPTGVAVPGRKPAPVGRWHSCREEASKTAQWYRAAGPPANRCCRTRPKTRSCWSRRLLSEAQAVLAYPCRAFDLGSRARLSRMSG